MTTSPVDFAETKPVDETVAILVLLDVHVIDGFDVVLGNTVAFNCNVFPV